MRWDITLRDPLGELPDIILNTFGEEGYQRSDLLKINLREFSQDGAPILVGTRRKRYTWQFAVTITELEALAIEGMIEEQQDRYDDFQDGHLLLLDEVEYLRPEPAPHSRTLISGSALAVNGRSTGFGQHKVLLTLPENHRKQQGFRDPDQVKLFQFGAIELP